MRSRFTFIFFSTALIILYSCTQGKYAATNKAYKKQAKEFSLLLKEYPLKDSAGLNYAQPWVGTTNFSVRRPNYVIIHHTAQEGYGNITSLTTKFDQLFTNTFAPSNYALYCLRFELSFIACTLNTGIDE